jgi:uncharacterized protein YjgD (DUF1641 family)
MSDDQTANTDEQNTGPPGDGHDGQVPPELVTAVENNPEEVARLIQNAGQVNDLLDASAVATAAIDDGMVQRLAEDGSHLGAAADGAATPELAELGESLGENADSLAEGVETVVELQESGTLDDIAEFADILALLSAAMDDEMVTSLTGTGSRLGELADTASDDEVAAGLESMLHAVGDATSEDPDPVGLMGLVKALRDPEVRAGMGVAIALLRALGQGTADSQSSRRDAV